MSFRIKSKLDGEVFKDVRERRFGDLCIVFQHGSKASGHRLALKADEKIIAAGDRVPYEFPSYIAVGNRIFMAVSDYFDGELIECETPYELMSGMII